MLQVHSAKQFADGAVPHYAGTQEQHWDHPDVFLSHSGSHMDVEAADVIREALECAGYNVFFDTELTPGDEAEKRQLHAAETAKIGVVLLTTDFVSSLWPMKELQIFAKHGRLVPLFYTVTPEECQNPPEVWTDFAAKVSHIVSWFTKQLTQLHSVWTYCCGCNIDQSAVSVMCNVY